LKTMHLVVYSVGKTPINKLNNSRSFIVTPGLTCPQKSKVNFRKLVWQFFLQAGHLSCHPTCSVMKAMFSSNIL